MVLTLVICAVLAAPAGAPPELPQPLQGLEAFVEDADAFVETLRGVDKRREERAHLLLARARHLDPQTQRALQERLAAEARRLMDEVRAAYDYGLYHHPHHPRLLTYFGELLMDWYREQEQGALAWRKALAEDNNLAVAHANLGLYLCARGNMQMGFEHVDRALDLEPDNPAFLYNLSQVYLLGRDAAMEARGWKPEKLYREALRASEKAAQLAPHDYGFLKGYAETLFAARHFDLSPDWEEAGEAWQRARMNAPDMDGVFTAWLNQARALIFAELHPQAEQCLLQALRIRPKQADATALLEGIRSGLEF